MALGASRLTGLARYRIPIVVGGGSDYLAHAAQNSPYLDFLSIDGSTLTDLTSEPDTSPGASIFASSGWHPDGVYFATYQNASPFLKIYKRDGDTFELLTSAVDTQVNAVGNAACSLMWSPDGNYLAVSGGSSTTGKMAWYSWDSGTETATKLTNPSNVPAGTNAWSCAWNGTSDKLWVGFESSPFYYQYSRSGDTLTADSGIFTGTTAPGARTFGAMWSHDGSRLALAYNTTDTWIYTDDGDGTYTRETTLGYGGFGVCWSPDDSILMCNNSSSIRAYHRSGSTYTNITSNISAQPGGATDRMCMDFNNDGTLFAVGTSGTDELAFYTVSGTGTGTTFTKQSVPSGLSQNYGNARFQNGALIIY